VIAVAFAIVLTIGQLAKATDVVTEPTTTGADSNIVIRGGVIRLGSSIYVEQNSAHGAVGIIAYRLVNNCDLQIDLDRQADERIVAAIAEEDETLSRLGVTAGVSGGVDQANIYLYKAGTKVCANNSMFGTTGNLWVHLTYVKVPAV
jgi:hypothetical protein